MSPHPDETPRATPLPFNVKCDRWQECKERHDELRAQVETLQNEKRDDLARMWAAITDIGKGVARLEGRLAGYLLAAAVLASAIAIIAQKALK